MIYQTIKYIAKKQGLPIRQLEHDLGFANGTINKWDKASTLSIPKIKAVATKLGIDPYTLLLVGLDLDSVELKNER